MADKRLKISVYAIMKDEEQFFDRWIASMWDGGNGADEICVLDTGSKEGWRELLCDSARKFGMPEDKLILDQKIYSPWRFDTPRNDSMKLISDDADICICTDLDEVLESGWGAELRRVAEENPTAGQFYYYYAWNNDSDTGEPKRYFWYNKCHRHPRYGVEWKYPVHETLTYTDIYRKMFPDSARMSDQTIWLRHYPDSTKSRGSYLGLLELRAQESPEDMYGLFYLAREYASYHKWERAIQWASYLLARIRITGNDDMLMEPALYVLLGDCYDAIGSNDDCEFCYREAIKKYPTYRDAYIQLAQKLAYSNRPAECFEILAEMEDNSVRIPDWRNLDYMWRDWKVRQIRADALMWMRKYKEAMQELEAGLADIKTSDDKYEAERANFYADYNFCVNKLIKMQNTQKENNSESNYSEEQHDDSAIVQPRPRTASEDASRPESKGEASADQR